MLRGAAEHSSGSGPEASWAAPSVSGTHAVRLRHARDVDGGVQRLGPAVGRAPGRVTDSTNRASRWRSLDSGSERLKKWKANCHGGRLR